MDITKHHMGIVSRESRETCKIVVGYQAVKLVKHIHTIHLVCSVFHRPA